MSRVNTISKEKTGVTTAQTAIFKTLASALLVGGVAFGVTGCGSDNNKTSASTATDGTGGNGDSTATDSNNDVSPASDEPLILKDAKLLIEHNATDEDTGFQGFVDGSPWNELAVSGPGEEGVLKVNPEGGLFGFGLTELFFETSEPENSEVPIENVISRLAEGEYKTTGDIVGAEKSEFTTTFSHNIPAGPELVSPQDEATGVDPTSVVISWDPVSKNIQGTDLAIVGYQVIVEEDNEPAFSQGFAKSEFNVYLPSDATRVSVPAEFIGNDKCYKYEVLAIEQSGNQTLSSAGFETGAGCNREEPVAENTPQLKAAKLLIEHNATDKDTGFQGFGDGDPWNNLTINGPTGEPVLRVNPEGGLFNFGLTELFFETSEPLNNEVPINDVLAHLPEGTYSFTGDMVDGNSSTLTANFTHDIPSGPVLTNPIEGASDVDPDNTVVSWESVTKDIDGENINIVGYQVIVEIDEDAEFPLGFARPEYSVYMPATATSVKVPSEFMESGETYAYEVLAIEESGNQTLSSAEFETK